MSDDKEFQALARSLRSLRRWVIALTLMMVASVFAEAWYYATTDEPDRWSRMWNAMETGDFDSALAIAESLRDERPYDVNAVKALGRIHWLMGRREQSIRYYKVAAEMDPLPRYNRSYDALFKRVEDNGSE